MASQPEFEGKDLEDALQQAAEALDTPEEDLHYEILEQGRRGLFGLGARSVRIKMIPPLDTLPSTDVSGAPPKSRPKRRARPERSRKPKGRSESAMPAQQLELQPEDTDVQQTVQRMIELMGLELNVGASRTDGGLSLKLEGPDRRMLTSRNGELQSSIQFLLNRMARRTWPDVGRINLGEGKSRKRDDDIVAMAKKVAEQVARSGKTKELQPMNAYERRLVHLTIREHSGLSSSSSGNGSMKRIRVSKIQNAI